MSKLKPIILLPLPSTPYKSKQRALLSPYILDPDANGTGRDTGRASIRGNWLAFPRTTVEQYRSQSTGPQISRPFPTTPRRGQASVAAKENTKRRLVWFDWFAVMLCTVNGWRTEMPPDGTSTWTPRLGSKVASVISEANLSSLKWLYNGPL